MNDFERDVIERLSRIETMLDADHRAIHGNGHPGLIDNMNADSLRIKLVEDRLDAYEKRKNNLPVWIGLFLTAITSAIACFKK